jgi:hypothetical protein
LRASHEELEVTTVLGDAESSLNQSTDFEGAMTRVGLHRIQR